MIADGLVIKAFGLVIDEASLTGESDPMHKGPKDPWCRSGTQVRPALASSAAHQALREYHWVFMVLPEVVRRRFPALAAVACR